MNPPARRVHVLVMVVAWMVLAPAVSRAEGGSERQAAKLLEQGISLLEQGKPADAEVLFRRAVALAPEKGAPHFYLGKALALQHRCTEAVPELTRYAELSTRGDLLDEATGMIRSCRAELDAAQPAQAGAAPPAGVAPPVVGDESEPSLRLAVEGRLSMAAPMHLDSPSGLVLSGGLSIPLAHPRADLTLGVSLFLGGDQGFSGGLAAEAGFRGPLGWRGLGWGINVGGGVCKYVLEDLSGGPPPVMSATLLYVAPEILYMGRVRGELGLVGVRAALGTVDAYSIESSVPVSGDPSSIEVRTLMIFVGAMYVL